MKTYIHMRPAQVSISTVYILPLRNENAVKKAMRPTEIINVYILPLRNENLGIFLASFKTVLVYILPLRNENFKTTSTFANTFLRLYPTFKE